MDERPEPGPAADEGDGARDLPREPDAAEPTAAADAVDADAGAADEREGAYELLQRGTDLMRQRHHAQAAVVLSRAAVAEPNKGSILEALGRACFNSGQHERARETFERLLEVDPSSPYGHYALGQSLKRLGRTTEARTHLRLAVALDPHSPLYRGALDRIGPKAPPDS